MKNALIPFAAFAGLAAADLTLNFAQIQAAPLPSLTSVPVTGNATYDNSSAAATISGNVQPTDASAPSKAKRQQECSAYPNGTAPTVSPDTDDAFSNYYYWSYEANVQIPPFPYIEKFRNLNGSTQQNSYLTYFILNSYDVQQCASYCNSNALCTAFNIYVERDPSLNPGPDCPNPPSESNYKCALWGSSISWQTATNVGQWREDFHVVIAGSNGYEKTNWSLPLPIHGFVAAVNLSSQVIVTTDSVNSSNTYLGSQFFTGPYDPSLCGLYATTQTQANRDAAQQDGNDTYAPANMFNSYYIYKDEVAWGTSCSLFTTNLTSQDAGDVDAEDDGSYFNVGSSWTYTLDPQDDGSLGTESES